MEINYIIRQIPNTRKYKVYVPRELTNRVATRLDAIKEYDVTRTSTFYRDYKGVTNAGLIEVSVWFNRTKTRHEEWMLLEQEVSKAINAIRSNEKD